MSTIMPHGPRITVGRSDIEELRAAGPRALLVWHEARDLVFVTSQGYVPGGEAMIIAGHEDVNDMLSFHADEGLDCTSGDIAQTFTDLANEALDAWPTVWPLAATGHGLRREMTDAGLYLTAAPEIQRDGSDTTVTDTYRWGEEPLFKVRLSTGATPGLAATAKISHDRRGVLTDLVLGATGPRTSLGRAAATGAITSVLDALLEA